MCGTKYDKSNLYTEMKFIKDVGITFLTRIVCLIIGIAVSVIVARVLGPQGQGI